MRVLMLAQFYPPVVGGEERMVHDLSRELASRGCETAVATLRQDGLADFELDGAVRIYRLPSTTGRATWLYSERERQHLPPFPDPEVVRALKKVLDRERPEIVHGHNWMTYSFLPLKSLSAARVVMSLHDCSLVCPKKRFIHRGVPCSGPGLAKCLACASRHYGVGKGVSTTIAQRIVAPAMRRAVDVFVPISDAVAMRCGLPGSGLHYEVVPNFVRDDLADARNGFDPTLLDALPSEPFVLFAGDLARDKGIEVLLEAHQSLRDAPPLVLIGRTIDVEPAESPNVVALGTWPHEALLAAFQRCAVAVVPSVLPEGFGLVALEAMACGTAVIASRTGGLPDVVVDGETGLLVPPGDPEALSRALQSLLADPGLRRRMGLAGRQRAAAFNASAVVPRFERLYEATRSAPANRHRAPTSSLADG